MIGRFPPIVFDIVKLPVVSNVLKFRHGLTYSILNQLKMIVTAYDMCTYLGRFSFEIHDESV